MSQQFANNDYSPLRLSSLCIDVTMVGQIQGHQYSLLTCLDLPFPLWHQYINCTASVGSNHCFQAIGTYRNCSCGYKYSVRYTSHLLLFFFFFAYKRYDFFLLKKPILHVLVISGTRSWKQHIYNILSVVILYSINCLHIYTEQMYLDHQRWSNNKEKLSKPSFLPSIEHICFSILIFCFK